MSATPVELRIAKLGESQHRHRFGGSTWRILAPSGAEPPPVLLACLDLTDPHLSSIGADFTELPLCSRVDGTSLDDQVYRLDPSQGVVCYLSPGWRAAIDDEDRLDQIAEKSLCLRVPRPEELAPETAVDTFLGGSGFFRVGGEPIWLSDPRKVSCECGRAPALVASVGYENYEKPGGFVATGPFFLGEIALFFFVCPTCRVVTVVTQPV